MFDLKAYAKSHGLRLKHNDAREPVCPSRGSKLQGCHLYDGFDLGCGLWIESKTAARATNLFKKALKLGCTPLQQGDLEKTVFVPINAIPTVSRAFSIAKSKQGFARSA